jgi:hypothetical protein
MRSGADLEGEHKLVLRAVEGAHAAVGLVPDAEVLEFGEDLLAGGEQFAHVPPVHAHESDRSVPTAVRRGAQGLHQERGEGVPRHLAYPHRELAMAHPAEAADMAVNRHVVWWIGEDEVDLLGSKKRLIIGRPPCISTDQTMTPELPDVSHPTDRLL